MRVLAMGANPWDVVACCGGTLVRYAQQKDEVTLASLWGSRSGTTSARVVEAGAAAAMVLGVEYAGDGLSSRSLDDVRASRDEVMDVIRKADPQVILAPPAESASHAERQVARLVFNAGYCACVPNYPSPTDLDACSSRAAILNMDAVGALLDDAPTYVDVGEVWETKMRALAVFDADGLPTRVATVRSRAEIVSRARGIQTQVEFAEAFGVEPAWGRLRTRRLLP